MLGFQNQQLEMEEVIMKVGKKKTHKSERQEIRKEKVINKHFFYLLNYLLQIFVKVNLIKKKNCKIRTNCTT